MSATITVEVVFAMPAQQWLGRIEVPARTTARDALLASPLVAEFPEFDFTACPVGVWGTPVADQQPLTDGDRVEAYRELLHDPREARRELARQGQSMGTAAKDPD